MTKEKFISLGLKGNNDNEQREFGRESHFNKRMSILGDVKQVKTGAEIAYEHQDSETTHWLNYLSGNEELPQNLRLSVFREKIGQELKTGGGNVPKNFSEMSYEDIKRFVFTSTEARKVFSQNFVDYYTVNGADVLDDYVPSKLSKNSKIYTTLWNIEGMAGNPKIRSTPVGRAHYYPPQTQCI